MKSTCSDYSVVTVSMVCRLVVMVSDGHKGLCLVCTGHICCIRLILGPERGYLNPLVQENHCKYDQSGWSYKYLETHVFRCAKKKNPKKSFFIIFMGSNLVKMPAQTQLAVFRHSLHRFVWQIWSIHDITD